MNLARAALDFFDGGKKWYQGGLSSPDHEKLCLVGALRTVGFSSILGAPNNYFHVIDSVILSEFHDRVGDRDLPEGSAFAFSSIMTFNDHPDTTFADVERVLEKTEARLEEMV